MKSIAFEISDDELDSDGDDIFTPKILCKQAKAEKDLLSSAESTISAKKRRTVYEIERDAKVAKLLQEQQQQQQQQQQHKKEEEMEELRKVNVNYTPTLQHDNDAEINIKTNANLSYTNNTRSVNKNSSNNQVEERHTNTTQIPNKEKPQLTEEQRRQRTYRKNLYVMRNALKEVDPESKQLAQLKTTNASPTNINNIITINNAYSMYNNDSNNLRTNYVRGGRNSNNNIGNNSDNNSYYTINKQGVQMYRGSGNSRGGYRGRGNRYNNSGNSCNNRSNDNANKRRRFD